MLKRCSKCGFEKDIREFSHNRSRKDGFHNWCKTCEATYREDHKEEKAKRMRIYRELNKEDIVKYREKHKLEKAKQQRVYRQTDKGKLVCKTNNHKHRALKKNLEATLTTKQWAYILKKQNNRCNRCGKKFPAKRQPTQDHIIPVTHNGGYTSENIQALCLSCNSSKKAKLDLEFIQTWSHRQ